MKKQYLIISFSVLLLFILIGYMTWDLFMATPEDQNPHAYNMNQLRQKEGVIPDYFQCDSIQVGFAQPQALTLDDSGNIYVAGINRLDILDSGGTPKQRFSFPDTVTAMAVGMGGPDSLSGLIWLGMVDHVAGMDRKGKLVFRWPSFSPRSLITSLALSENRVYVADAGNKMVLVYDYKGHMISQIGGGDSLRGIPRLLIPSPYFDVAIGRDNEIWVVNPGRHLVEAFRPDGSLISMWGETGMDLEGFCGCCNPTHIAVMRNGSFVTSEKGLERVKVYSPSGVYQELVAGPESFAEGTTGLDLSVGPENRIFVLDPRKKLIRVFEKAE